MPLQSGARLGPYEILAPLGAGGMGEVYRARDGTLNRDVAIKVLLPSVADDPDRLARFRREAQVLASLNHPNIAHIHGLEDFPAEGGGRVRALVMELVEGDDLAVLIARGPMPLDEALPIAKQIADALEAAHEQGIIHRDLKPANIKVRPDGTVKVLDFGLAKAMDPAGASSANAMNSPTLSIHATQAGIILGTAAYMSPEQARGAVVDRRADIWAFGVVLFEMLTGRRAFEGETVSDTLAAVLKTDPSWSALPADVPPRLHELLRRCIEKAPKRRLQAIGEARLQIEEALGGAPGSPLQSVSRAAPRKAIIAASIASAVATAILVTTVFLAMGNWRRPPPDSRLVRFTIPLPPRAEWIQRRGFDLALAPDGSRLAFVATADGTPRVWIRSLDSLNAQALPGTEGATAPFWSPDGRHLAFVAGGKLKRIELAGASTPRTVGSAPPSSVGGTWNAAGVILLGSRSGLHRVADSGGEPVRILPVEGSADTDLLWPHFLPDGRRFLYLASTTDTAHRGVFVGSLDSPSTTRVMDGDSNAVYAPSGHLLFARNASLLAQSFDLDRLAVSGEPFPVADGVVRGLPLTYAAFSVSQNGALVYLDARSATDSQLTWFDRSGKEVGPVGPPRDARVPVLSANGQKAAVDRLDPELGTRDAWVIDVARGYETRLTTHPANDFAPLLSPDGTRGVFASDRGGPQAALYLKSASGDGPEELIVSAGGDKRPYDWSGDGTGMLFGDSLATWLLPMSGPGERKPVRVTPPGATREWHPRLSPDGQWIVFDTSESGRWEIYVRRFPSGGEKWRVSTDGGWDARWHADGQEIFYLNPEGTLMAVPVKTGTTFESGIAQPLFATPLKGRVEASYANRSTYAVARDGQRFLFTQRSAGGNATPIMVVLGWDAGAKR